MKRYINFFAFTMMAVFCLSLVSCGDDGDDFAPNNEGSGTSTSDQFSFKVNGNNYYYGQTYTWPGLDTKQSVTYCKFSSTGEYYGHSLFSLYVDAQDMPYKAFDSDGKPIIFQEYNSNIECSFMLIDFNPSTAKQGDVFGFKQVVKEVYSGVVYDIYNTIKYREKSQGDDKSITFSWKDENPKGQVKFISYRKMENGDYVLTMDFQNVTLDRITDNSNYENKADRLVLNGKVIFTDNSTGLIN